MERIYRNILVGIVGMITIFVLSNIAYAAQNSDSIIINQSVANCNNNGVCDSYENANVCPNDCGTAPATSTPAVVESGFAISTSVKFGISNIEVETGSDSASITFTTNKISGADFEWGSSLRYGNILLSRDLQIKHTFYIDNLKSDTTYYYLIRVMSISGEISEYKGVLKTQSEQPKKKEEKKSEIKEEKLVTNVFGFQAVVRDSGIELIWTNPIDDNFAGVRIVRSDKSVPTDPYAGKVVFEGKSSAYLDEDVEVGKIYFYTVFSYDNSGNFSSGVIAQAIIPKQTTEEVIVEDESEIVESPTIYTPPDILEAIEDSPIRIPDINKLVIKDFEIIQNSRLIEPDRGSIVLDIGKPFKVRISYDKVPETFKNMVIRIYKDKNKEEKITFLLRADEEKTEYKALVPPLGEVGLYGIEMYLLDFNNRKLKALTSSIVGVSKGGVVLESREKVYNWEEVSMYVSVLSIVSVFIWIFYRTIISLLIP